MLSCCCCRCCCCARHPAKPAQPFVTHNASLPGSDQSREAYLLLTKRALAHSLSFFFSPRLFKSSRIGFSHLHPIFTSTSEAFSSSYQMLHLLPPIFFSNSVIIFFSRSSLVVCQHLISFFFSRAARSLLAVVQSWHHPIF